VLILKSNGLFIGNSSGIGLETTKRLLEKEWKITGISRSGSGITKAGYHHHIMDVSNHEYESLLGKITQEIDIDLCIYFVGIGELLNLDEMSEDLKVFDANLIGLVKTIAVILPQMVERGRGHFIGISSVADDLLSSEAPSYHASKAGFSNYLEGLGLALKSTKVDVTNVRFGFVDTKMAKGDIRPFMMSSQKAVDHLEICIQKRPIRYTAPKIVIPMIKFRKLMMRLGAA
jgi:short-subunit dehydrogenase